MKYTKDPDATLDYGFNWSQWLADGETITASSWTVQSGLTGTSPSYTTTATSIRLSGGTAGTTYTAANKITTSTGQIDERTLYIRVENR